MSFHPVGMGKGGMMTWTNGIEGSAWPMSLDRAGASASSGRQARENLALLFCKLSALYTGGGTTSLSRSEAAQLATSLSYQLGLNGAPDAEAVRILCSATPDELLQHAQTRLAKRTDAALLTWREACETMPPFRNVALRDTLVSIGNVKRTYDTYFAAHEAPCCIDYPLSCPIDERLQGIDYLQAWLDQLLIEARYAAGYTFESCIAVLEQACPDYRGLHVNLHDLLRMNESELVRKE